jgi:hypothetical protein
MLQVDLSPRQRVRVIAPWYAKGMVNKKTADNATKQVRLYPKEYGVLWRLAHRKHTTIAEIIRSLIKGI